MNLSQSDPSFEVLTAVDVVLTFSRDLSIAMPMFKTFLLLCQCLRQKTYLDCLFDIGHEICIESILCPYFFSPLTTTV